MPATPLTPRARWIEAGLEVLAENGPEAVRVEVLAAKLGVTKGGFYGHFDGRPALLGEMLDTWEQQNTHRVLANVAGEGGDARAMLRRVGQLTAGDEMNRLDLAIRNWARHDPAVAKRLRRIDDQRMDFLRAMFGELLDDPDEIEARATLMFALAIGRHFIAAKHRGRTKREVVQLAAELLMRAPAKMAKKRK